jgi:hypothetical protein
MDSVAARDFKVRFSTTVARVVEYSDVGGTLEFTLDGGSKGDKSVCLEHHPSTGPRDERYRIAFGRTKEFLESCGFEVEIYGRA